MHATMIAAAAAAMLFAAAPQAGQTFASLATPFDPFKPLTCAMANSGSCDQGSLTAASNHKSDIYLLAKREVVSSDAAE